MKQVFPSARWFQNQVLSWYHQHGRHDLPWKKSMSPYSVWVSEIMLQQTQVATVIPYFAKFMKSFPTVTKLKKASLDAVLSHWAGLGYYARGRNLHKTSIEIIERFSGVFPQTVEELITLPGIGLSTAGAIVAQAFDKPATICDGNVKRVLSRFHCVAGSPTIKKVESKLWDLADFYTPKTQVANYTQAMMDIGATICTRSSPNCNACPLQKRCQANLEDRQAHYPEKKAPRTLPTRVVFMLCVLNNNQLLLQKRPLTGIWGGLWSLPEFNSKTEMDDFILDNLGAKSSKATSLPQMKHSFTHYHLDIKPRLLHLLAKKLPMLERSFHWVNLVDIKDLGLPAPVKRIIKYDSMRQKQRAS